MIEKFVGLRGHASVCLACGLFSNLLCTKALVKILTLGRREIAPVGVSFVTSAEKECWDRARTSKLQRTIKNTDSPRSPQAPSAGAVDLESAQPSQSTGYHSNSGCRPPAVSRHIIPSPSRIYTHSCTWTLNCRLRWLHTCTKFCTPSKHKPTRSPCTRKEWAHSLERSHEFSWSVVWHKAFCRKHTGLFVWMFKVALYSFRLIDKQVKP